MFSILYLIGMVLTAGFLYYEFKKEPLPKDMYLWTVALFAIILWPVYAGVALYFFIEDKIKNR